MKTVLTNRIEAALSTALSCSITGTAAATMRFYFTNKETLKAVSMADQAQNDAEKRYNVGSSLTSDHDNVASFEVQAGVRKPMQWQRCGQRKH
jgi:hypothetical protein